MQAERKNKRQIRIISMSCPVANGKDLALWMGINPEDSFFNFSQSVRPQPLEVSVMAFDQFSRTNR
jgi:replicative superfamily II helicase